MPLNVWFEFEHFLITQSDQCCILCLSLTQPIRIAAALLCSKILDFVTLDLLKISVCPFIPSIKLSLKLQHDGTWIKGGFELTQQSSQGEIVSLNNCDANLILSEFRVFSSISQPEY